MMEKAMTKARQGNAVKKQQHAIHNQFQEHMEEVSLYTKKPLKKQSPPTQLNSTRTTGK